MTDGTNGAIDWAKGDATGLDLPAHGPALQAGGPDWLTRAFRASGALRADQAVTAITRADALVAGGTGTKLILSVAYAGPGAEALPRDLFVKFSRNADDPVRDNARFLMAPEVRLAALSRHPAFPIAVPACLFADYEGASGTGLIITARIAFGEAGVEPARDKCMEHLLPDALDHYRAVLRALARLAGTHRAGALDPAAEQDFPRDIDRLIAGDTNPYSADRLANRARRMADFVAACPRLFPATVTDPAFLAGFVTDAPRFPAHEAAIKARLHADPDMIALCHWNANIDNGWYWRDADGVLQCGLLDWGGVGQIHLAMALWGCLSGAEAGFWDAHLDALLAQFAADYAAAGGPRINPASLSACLELQVMIMGLAWLIDAPPRIRLEIPDAETLTGPCDPRLDHHEMARVQTKMTANFLNFWARRDLGRHLR